MRSQSATMQTPPESFRGEAAERFGVSGEGRRGQRRNGDLPEESTDIATQVSGTVGTRREECRDATRPEHHVFLQGRHPICRDVGTVGMMKPPPSTQHPADRASGKRTIRGGGLSSFTQRTTVCHGKHHWKTSRQSRHGPGFSYCKIRSC